MAMNQFPNNFSDDSENNLSQLEAKIDRKPEAENLSIENVAKTKQQLQRIFLTLLGIGLGLGILVSVGVVAVMNYFNLKEIPTRNEKLELPQQKDSTDRDRKQESLEKQEPNLDKVPKI
jgi:ABC-type lipoprotein release transport system permease subunit